MNMNIKLPYDNTHPVWYDNDWANDYVDFYLMALASAGDIQYKGISTSSSIPPYNQHMTSADLDKQIALRNEIVERGRQSGFCNLPDPIPGCRGNLQKPDSGKPEDTVPLDSVATRRIIEEAHAAGSSKPLVVVVGGPCTVVANAWIIDPSIADKMIIAFLDNYDYGMTGYNGWSDGWAASIVIQKLQLVQFTVESNAFARVTKEQLLELPQCPAREYFLPITTDIVCSDGDCDGPPAIPLKRNDYVKKVNRVSFGGYTEINEHEMPIFRDDPTSRSIVCVEANADIATQEWWRALKNPMIWK